MASIAINYARAFAEVVLSLQLDANRVRDELHSLVETVEGSAELRRVWDSPAIGAAEKLRLLDAIAQHAGLETAVRNFVAVVIEHGRMAALPAIARQFELELNRRLGFVEAGIASARDLSPQEKSALESQVAQLTGSKVRARYDIDKTLLGGAVVKVGSTIYDGSLRGQLRRLKEQLTES
jgi:F-type H+-transporting ATPase subunit delta